MTVRAIVKPELLRWAREDAGLAVEQVARKVGTSPQRVASWESGDARPTVKQLRKVAGVYKRPLAVFYLERPPKSFQAMHDFRQLPGTAFGEESPDLRLEIRQAAHRREIALALFDSLDETPPRFELRADLGSDAERLATRLRKRLGIRFEEQVTWREPYAVLSAWRAALEAHGVLVFQFSGVSIEEARGFSIGHPVLPLVAVNSKDSPRGRVFSMIHELVHVVLRRTGLCDFGERGSRPEDRRVEVFCNHVAGATLVPGELLSAESLVTEHRSSATWSDEEIRTLARRFGVSREALLRRLVLLGRAPQELYREKREQYLAEYRQRSSEGFAPVPVRTVSQVGRLFARLVLDSYHHERITASDVSAFLGVRLKHLPRIELEVLGREREFKAAG